MIGGAIVTFEEIVAARVNTVGERDVISAVTDIVGVGGNDEVGVA
jgi:hypothetical protein